MNRKIGWFLILVASCSRIPGAAEAKPHASTSTKASAEAEAVSPLTGVAAVYQRSYDEEAAGRFEEALKALDALPAPQREAYFTQFREGWLLYKLGRHVDAVASYQKAAALEADSVEARVAALYPEAAAHRWHDVEKTAREVLGADPGNYNANLRLAFALYSQAHFAEAEKLYRRVLALYPSDADARNGLAWSLVKLGKRDEARRMFKETLDVVPRSPLALEGMRATK
jgi:tetratricopeptide (TPR) repeat protein